MNPNCKTNKLLLHIDLLCSKDQYFQTLATYNKALKTDVYNEATFLSKEHICHLCYRLTTEDYWPV